MKKIHNISIGFLFVFLFVPVIVKGQTSKPIIIYRDTIVIYQQIDTMLFLKNIEEKVETDFRNTYGFLNWRFDMASWITAVLAFLVTILLGAGIIYSWYHKTEVERYLGQMNAAAENLKAAELLVKKIENLQKTADHVIEEIISFQEEAFAGLFNGDVMSKSVYKEVECGIRILELGSRNEGRVIAALEALSQSNNKNVLNYIKPLMTDEGRSVNIRLSATAAYCRIVDRLKI